MPSGIAAVARIIARRRCQAAIASVRLRKCVPMPRKGPDHHPDHQTDARTCGVDVLRRSAPAPPPAKMTAAAQRPGQQVEQRLQPLGPALAVPGLGRSLGRGRRPSAAPGAAACPSPAPPRPDAWHPPPCRRPGRGPAGQLRRPVAALVISRLTTLPATAEDQRQTPAAQCMAKISASSSGAVSRAMASAAAGRTARRARPRSSSSAALASTSGRPARWAVAEHGRHRQALGDVARDTAASRRGAG